MALREFSLEVEYPYNRSGPVRWIVSHALRYPLLPFLTLLADFGNNYAFSYVQIFTGRAFDLLITPGWARPARHVGPALSQGSLPY